MMKVRNIAAIAIASLLPMAASAQETRALGPTDWTGAYAGLQFGALSAMQDVDNVSTAAGVVRTWSPDPDGASGGVFFGYNWQRGASLVYGVEADVNWSGAEGRSVVTTPLLAGGNVVEAVDTNVRGTAALRGRVGYAAGDTLFYATAGLAWIRHEGVYLGTTNPAAGPPIVGNPLPWSDTARGWTAGIGLEHVLNDRWVGRIDYRYTDFGDLFYRPFGGALAVNNLLGNLSTHEIRVGIAMRF
jgi:outer membrane immunogenic protein